MRTYADAELSATIANKFIVHFNSHFLLRKVVFTGAAGKPMASTVPKTVYTCVLLSAQTSCKNIFLNWQF